MIHGFINLHKPLTWTSHDCVARVRRLLNTKKVGHGGTLDPLATGVLPLAVGRATRLLQYLPEEKTYRATIRFGVATSTDDLEGEALSKASAAHLTRQTVEAFLPKFIGTLDQTPPMYSAIQVDGKRLYDLARKGKEVEVPVRRVVIHTLTVEGWRRGEQPELTLEVACGGGTYIRSLARDLGEAVGTGATLAGLVRSRSSGFDISQSISLEALAQAIEQETFEPSPAGESMMHLAAIALPPTLCRRWQLGQKLPLKDVNPHLTPQLKQAPPHTPVRVMDPTTDTFLGIGEFRPGLPTVIDETQTNADPTEQIFAPKRVFLPLG
ncbi:MAG: tRNA pseudouridine(55) synthase TruB [Cyanobacteria bacterium J06629_19]